MKRILLSAFSCNPIKGSEDSYGWNWSIGLIREGFEVHTFTRIINKVDIENQPKIDNLFFHYIKLPLGLEKLYSFSQLTMYLYYILWQWVILIKAKQLHKSINFDKVHHVSWGSIQQGSFLYKLKIPFFFGPAGGGQKAPIEFKSYFKEYWAEEIKREKVSNLLLRYNPACKGMLNNAALVIVSNIDTFKFAELAGAKQPYLALDAGLPLNFFPSSFIEHKLQIGKIKLLWIGRFLPRKGLLLTLEVMNILKTIKDITLTIVGDGEMMNHVNNYIEKYQLSETVKLVGSVPFEEVKNYYYNHDAFFFTSLRDSCPMQLIEAMAYSLPVITLDLHGQGQIVNSSTGIKVPVDEPTIVIKNLAQEIISLANDSIIYQTMSKAAYYFAKKQVWEIKIKEIVNRFY